MTDKELIRRALIGDREARDLCTDKGIAIPCPFCQGDKTARRCVCGEGFIECLTCHATSSMRSNPDEALKDWNTRPAPPVGRCKDCFHYHSEGPGVGYCSLDDQGREETNFCSEFELKEG